MKNREETNWVIFHHSLSKDVSAERIREWHLEKGWSDIGYHWVIRKSGLIERGRNILLMGAHSKGRNKDSIGVCLAGNFDLSFPTFEQLISCKKIYHDMCTSFSKKLKVGFHRWLWNPCPGRRFNRSHFLAEMDKAW